MNEEREVKLLKLEGGTIRVVDIVAVVKIDQPATLQTPEVPHLQFNLRDTQAVFIPYENDEARDKDYAIAQEAMKSF